MIGLLSGMRPGELARLKWSDLLPRQRCFVIRGAKATNDVSVPMSAAIASAFKSRTRCSTRRQDRKRMGVSRLGPGSYRQVRCRSPPGLGHDVPADVAHYRGRCWRRRIDRAFLLGAYPRRDQPRLCVQDDLASGQGMRAAQRTVSKRIVGLLGIALYRHRQFGRHTCCNQNFKNSGLFLWSSESRAPWDSSVRDTAGKFLGDCYVTMTGVQWCRGKTPQGRGVKIDWATFIKETEARYPLGPY